MYLSIKKLKKNLEEIKCKQSHMFLEQHCTSQRDKTNQLFDDNSLVCIKDSYGIYTTVN